MQPVWDENGKANGKFIYTYLNTRDNIKDRAFKAPLFDFLIMGGQFQHRFGCNLA